MLPKAILLKKNLYELDPIYINRKSKNKIKGNNQTNPESGTSLKDNRLEFFKKSVRQAGGRERCPGGKPE